MQRGSVIRERPVLALTNWFETFKASAPVITRHAIGIPFLFIGIDQLIRPEFWYSYFPTWFVERMGSTASAVLYNGIFDVAIGILLIMGLFTRIVAAIASLHLMAVVITLGYNDISIRDLGLLVVALSVLCYGPDSRSLDYVFARKSLMRA